MPRCIYKTKSGRRCKKTQSYQLCHIHQAFVEDCFDDTPHLNQIVLEEQEDTILEHVPPLVPIIPIVREVDELPEEFRVAPVPAPVQAPVIELILEPVPASVPAPIVAPVDTPVVELILEPVPASAPESVPAPIVAPVDAPVPDVEPQEARFHPIWAYPVSDPLLATDSPSLEGSPEPPVLEIRDFQQVMLQIPFQYIPTPVNTFPQILPQLIQEVLEDPSKHIKQAQEQEQKEEPIPSNELLSIPPSFLVSLFHWGPTIAIAGIAIGIAIYLIPKSR